MMRTVTLFILTLFTACRTASAQQVLFSDNFDALPGYNITGWTQNNGSVSDPWSAGLPYLIGGLCFTPPGDVSSQGKIAGFVDQHMNLGSGLCTADNNESLLFLYSPQVAYVPGAWLQYDSYFLGDVVNGKTESAQVMISGDNASSWNIIQQVPAYANGFKRYYIQVPYYANATGLQVGFNYTDQGERMRGWMIDNVKLFVPAQKDLELNKLVPDDSMLRYVILGQSILLGGTVTNMGLDTVTNFVVKYQETTGGPVATDTISNITIPPFEHYNFTHNIPYTVTTAGTHKINVWVELAGDTNTSNNQLATDVRGITFRPEKKLAVEVGTHTMNSWCPRSLYYMDSLKKLAILEDADVSIVAVHPQQDPMDEQVYSTFLYNLRQYFVPYFLFDRRENADPDSFFSVFNKEKNYFGFADLDLSSALNGSEFTIVTTVKPAIDLHGDFRLALILTEDNVTGATSDYNQANSYAGGINGIMGGYETLPNPVPAADMHYNFVARNTIPAPDGDPGDLPPDMYAGQSYDVPITTTIDPSWNVSELNAVILLIRNGDSIILNSNHTASPLKIAGLPAVFNQLNLFPNPANEQTRLSYDLKEAQNVHITVSDITGKILYQYNEGHVNAGPHERIIPVSNLANGFYMVTINADSGHQAIKMEVVH